MIKIENVKVYGWGAAIRGMRNPLNSWEKSDSSWEFVNDEVKLVLCDNDLKLMKSLVKAGNDHAKFMRFITVTLDITAPLYWWKEFDTYKVGTVANSCSTMHKIADKEFTPDDFSTEHLQISAANLFVKILYWLNEYRSRYLEDKEKDDWWQMIQLLPTSYNQRRTVLLNYAVLRNIYHARKNHKLDEWREFCKWIETLPYSEFITEG